MATSRFSLFLSLTKPRITAMVLVTTSVGLCMGLLRVDHTPWRAIVLGLIGTWLLGGGASVLNMWLERELDALMERTARRPLPAKLISPHVARNFGFLLSGTGMVLLTLGVNTTTAAIGLFTLFSYVALYTPLKRRTAWATHVGAVPGALPIVMGWTMVGAPLDNAAVALFLVLFLWQLPHFFAIAWLYRHDYAQAGFSTLAEVGPSGGRLAFETIATTVALVAVSVSPPLVRLAGIAYAVFAIVLGVGFLVLAVRFARQRSAQLARRTVLYSVSYLPLLLGSLVVAAWVRDLF